MSLRSKILASACVIAAVAIAAPASAANFDGVFSGDYSHLDANGGGSANEWGASGSGAFGFGGNWAGELDGGYHNIDGSGSNLSVWNVDGSIMWRGAQGRAGVVVGYQDANGGGTSINATNYGAFGEWYAGPQFTIGVKGGAFNGSHSISGDYLGARVTGYIMPNLSLSGEYDYTHLQHLGNENDYSADVEWMFSQTTPVSIYAGYTNSSISGAGTINTWSVGIKLYTDPMAGSMVDRQREGAATWGTSWHPLAFAL